MTEPPDKTSPRQPAFDRSQGYSGQDYDVGEEQRLASTMPAGSVNAEPSRLGVDEGDNGRRASFDPRTGEVHGSGAGAGGGNPGEDLDQDSAGGDGPAITSQ